MSQRSKEEREENQYMPFPLRLRLALLTSLVLVMESPETQMAKLFPHCRCRRKRAKDLGFSSKSTRLLAGDRASPLLSISGSSAPFIKMSKIIPNLSESGGTERDFTWDLVPGISICSLVLGCLPSLCRWLLM